MALRLIGCRGFTDPNIYRRNYKRLRVGSRKTSCYASSSERWSLTLTSRLASLGVFSYFTWPLLIYKPTTTIVLWICRTKMICAVAPSLDMCPSISSKKFIVAIPVVSRHTCPARFLRLYGAILAAVRGVLKPMQRQVLNRQESFIQILWLEMETLP